MMEGDLVIHLVSTGSSDLYQGNRADVFTNQLHTPILLDPNQEYEVGLVNIHLPKTFRIIRKNDYKCRIEVYKQNTFGKRFLFNYLPARDVRSSDLAFGEKLINKEFKDFFKTYTGYEIKDILKYNIETNRFQVKRGHITPNEYYIRFGTCLANTLGFDTEEYYSISSSEEGDTVKRVDAPYAANSNGDVQYMVVYSDVVKPSHFAGQEVNILDIFSIGIDGNRGFHNVIYKPLNTNIISSISIKLTDQKGESLSFIEDAVVTCSLQVRKRKII